MTKIFIDPGHGGYNNGAIGAGVIEKELNLNIALKVKEYLIINGFEVKTSREDDRFIELSERTKMANEWGADYLVSIHHNAGGGDGYEVIYSIKEGKSKDLAEAVAAEFKKTGQNMRKVFSRKNKAGDADYYAVIRGAGMPAIITEYAFLDTHDYIAIDTQEDWDIEAKAIVKGICIFLGITFKENNNKPIIDFEHHWAKNYIEIGMNEGIFVKTDIFRPNDPITRAEIAVVVSRLLKK